MRMLHLALATMLALPLTPRAQPPATDADLPAEVGTAAVTRGTNRQVVALGSFVNKADAPDSAFNTLVDRIKGSIVNTRKFEVVEQNRLKELIDYRAKMVDTGIVDTQDNNAPTPGKVMAAGYLVYGTVLSLGTKEVDTASAGLASRKHESRVELQVEITNAESGKVVASKTVNVIRMAGTTATEGQSVRSTQNADVLQEAIAAAAQEVSNALVDLAFPAKILRVSPNGEIILNLTAEQARVNELYNVFQTGDEMLDPDTGESLGAEETFLGRLSIVRTSPKFSYAVAIEGLYPQQLAAGMTVRRVSEEELRELNAAKKKKAQQKFESRF